MKRVTTTTTPTDTKGFPFFFPLWERICQVSTHPTLFLHWQQTCFECLCMNLTDVSDLFQSESYLWLGGAREKKGKMYVYTACQECCRGERQCVYDSTHHWVNMSYIATLMRTGDPEKQLMYSLERHCNTTARCSLHTTSGELRLMTEIIRTPVFIGLRATQEVKRAS